jgi:hypothetical protein
MRRNSPPALACLLLESVLPACYRDAMLGDLIEEHATRTESSSSFSACWWFWSQTCRSVPFLMWSSLRRGWLITMGVTTGVYIVMAMFKFAADLMISKWVAPEPMTHVVLAPVVFLVTTAMGGCVAAGIRRGATIFLAFAVAVTVVVLISLNLCPLAVPWWYQAGFLILGPLTVLITPTTLGVLKPRAGEHAS